MGGAAVIVTGDRQWAARGIVLEVLDLLPRSWTILHGAAPGLDTIAGLALVRLGWHRDLIERFPADWAGLGDKAGPARNRAMLAAHLDDLAYVLAFHDDLMGRSKGTRHICRIALQAGVPVYLFRSTTTDVIRVALSAVVP